MSDELDLRACLEVLFRGRWLVVLVVAATMAIVGLVTFFVIDPTYQAETLVNVTPAQVSEPEGTASLSTRLQTLSEPPRVTPQAFAEQVTTNAVLDRVRETLGLDVTRRRLKRAIQIEVVEDADLVRLSAKWADARVAAGIVNELVAGAAGRVSSLEEERLQQLARSLEEEAQRQQAAAQAAVGDLQAFFATGPAAGELSAEVAAKAALLAEYRGRLPRLNVDIAALRGQVAAAEAQLAALPPLLTTEHSLLQDISGAGAGLAAGASAADLAALHLEGEEINPAWVALAEMLAQDRSRLAYLEAEKAQVVTAVGDLEAELAGLRATLAERRTEEDLLESRLATTRGACATLLREHNEVCLLSRSGLFENRIVVAGPAEPPLEPVAPRKVLNLAVAGVLGLFLGVSLVYFLDFWRRGSVPAAVDAGSR